MANPVRKKQIKNIGAGVSKAPKVVMKSATSDATYVAKPKVPTSVLKSSTKKMFKETLKPVMKLQRVTKIVKTKKG